MSSSVFVTDVQILGLLFIYAWLWINIRIRREKFSRRNKAGLLVYKNFTEAFFIGLLRKLIGFIADCFGVIGVLITALGLVLRMLTLVA
jgi:hypothetical protein